ncbi:cerebellar degeneration-related protein 2-like [Gadus chalcogrammus]|uniref:cerebellar degeneration-related protein 2-like n=1 Tax=Gadus chalcogrammus TaxID=1042646 RepID=UPI0024C4C315|nr:cerebellar degeneration-related protein 2-like [Gadus chalcogrammus]
MLTDMIVEEEFEIKEEEPWYDKRDLEHDLHLAAELGKTLLDRNKELEQGLQQMYSTNQEQLQEIEYLTKQVEVLRQVNEQHAKVYEQLDATSRDLEQTNHRLGLDNRGAQQKIQRLTETAEGLQSQAEDLQRELEDVKNSPPQRTSPPGDPRSTHSVSCLQELQSTLRYGDHDGSSDDLHAASSKLEWREEEQASLRRSLRALQTQLANERAGREEAEREADVLANENAALERQLDSMEGCRAQLAEVECEAAELRLLWRTERSARSAGRGMGHAHAAPPTALFHNHEDEEDEDHDDEDDDDGGDLVVAAAAVAAGSGTPQRPAPTGASAKRARARRSEAVKYRGISLLNEVDAQYSALQVKYEELLQRCGAPPRAPDGEGHSHKAIQTATATAPAAAPGRHASLGAACTDDIQQPEYKALFQEIFDCIQRTKEDLSGARGASTTPCC